MSLHATASVSTRQYTAKKLDLITIIKLNYAKHIGMQDFITYPGMTGMPSLQQFCETQSIWFKIATIHNKTILIKLLPLDAIKIPSYNIGLLASHVYETNVSPT